MVREIQLPCDGDGVCMRCKAKPPSEETLTCGTCVTHWHAPCLSAPPESLASTLQWWCPYCSAVVDPVSISGINRVKSDGLIIVAAICAIKADESLTETQKAKKRQRLMSVKTYGGDDDFQCPDCSNNVNIVHVSGISEFFTLF